MQISTVAKVIRQKKLAKQPVLNYHEANGKALIEVQLRSAKPVASEPLYDADKLIAILRAGRIRLGHPTNVTKDIRKERNSSPAIRRPRTKTQRG